MFRIFERKPCAVDRAGSGGGVQCRKAPRTRAAVSERARRVKPASQVVSRPPRETTWARRRSSVSLLPPNRAGRSGARRSVITAAASLLLLSLLQMTPAASPSLPPRCLIAQATAPNAPKATIQGPTVDAPTSRPTTAAGPPSTPSRIHHLLIEPTGRRIRIRHDDTKTPPTRAGGVSWACRRWTGNRSTVVQRLRGRL